MASERILVADDDPSLVTMVSWLLREHGYEVQTADRGNGVIEAMQGPPPDLVLLDIMMPDVDGVQLLERIKSDERWRDVPVMMLTALPPEEVAVRSLGLGAVDFVRKPFRVKELLARIQAQIKLVSTQRKLRDELRMAELALVRVREEVSSQRKLVDILHDVTGELDTDEIYRLLARRVARALDISHCSVVLARPGDETAIVATAFENPSLRNLPIRLDRYPEIRTALEEGVAVLIQDTRTNPLYNDVRKIWQEEGRNVPIRSVIALPFSLDRQHGGVFFLRTTEQEPALKSEDVEFADTVIRAAVAAIRRAQALESTRADNARLHELATTDPLTQLLNRRALLERLHHEMDRARRYGTVVTLLLLDIDHFKKVNDTYGHLVGDDILREVAALLQHAARAVDVVARYGGEEFVVVLPETGSEGAVAFADRVRERVAQHAFGGERHPDLRITVSIGVAPFPGPRIESAEELFARADEALYRAKTDGRNRVCT